MDTSFRYKPLNLEKNEIRLVSIEPGYPSDELVGHIFHVPLEKAPKYESLSYCWADGKGAGENSNIPEILNYQLVQRLNYAITQSFRPPANQGYIRLENQTFKLAVNLEAALRRLRPWTGELILWIDAICIDQFNIKERNEQVLKMKLIYEGAERVRVWLGESYDNSTAAFQFAKEFEEMSKSTDRDGIIKMLLDPKTLKFLDAAVLSFRRAYWLRVWVIQEIASAKDILIHCGSDTASWDQIAGLSKLATDYHPQLSLILTSDLWKIGTLLNKGPASFQRRSEITNEVPKKDFFSLLLSHINKESTNPKDRVYGLIGVSTARDDPNFILDYSRSLAKVYTSVVQYMMERYGSLNMICASGPGSKIPDLPSWVPDWTQTPKPTSLQNRNMTTSRAASDRKAEASIINNDKVLSAKGFRIAIIQQVGKKHTWPSIDHYAALRTFHGWRKILLDIGGTKRSDQESLMRSCFCNTYAGADLDHDASTFVPISQILGVFGSLSQGREHSWAKEMVDEQLKGFADEFRKAYVSDWFKVEKAYVTTIAEIMKGRTFFILNGGRIGTAANDIKVGDKVCAFFGCGFFVVLRERDENEGGGYMFVGEAYVDGLMGGEALTELEEGKYHVERFDIW